MVPAFGKPKIFVLGSQYDTVSWKGHLLPIINSSHFAPNSQFDLIFSPRSLPPLAFRPLKALKILDLGQNKIHNISQEAFYGARAVDTLDLSENLLNLVPNAALIAMENLAYLDLSSNPIKTIGKNCIQIYSNFKYSS